MSNLLAIRRVCVACIGEFESKNLAPRPQYRGYSRCGVHVPGFANFNDPVLWLPGDSA